MIKVENSQIPSEDVFKKFKTQVEPSLFLSKRFGNIYNGSLYLCLLSLLYQFPELNNKKALLFSYGSGICSTMLEFYIQANPVTQ